MDNMDYVVNKVLKVLREDIKKKTNGYDGIGTVERVDGDIAWVKLDKNKPTLTPVRISGAQCKKDDVVRVRVSNGTAFIQGNDTHAPTDDAKANEADAKAVLALDAAAEIRAIAEEAIQGNTENVENFTQAIMAINADIENIQEQIDGNITSWFYNVDPAMDRPPVTTDPADPDATGWDTDEKKNNHLGDLYYNVDTGKVWRFVFTNGSFSWSAVEDSDVTRALEMASRAQDTADSKRRVFVATPVVPYDVGDLWVQGSNGDIMRCVQAKTSAGSYSASDWIKASKYTDDSALTSWINGEFATTIQELETGIADAKVETFYQSTNPATNWTAAQKQEHAGDLWYDTSANKYYRYSGSAWEEVKATPPQAVFDRIDGKATIFVGSTTPSNPQAGDLWLKSANDDILTYVGNSWVKYNKYTDNTRANEAYDLANTAKISADGKNTVYRGSSMPTGGTYVTGDVWFDTGNDNQINRWDGTRWVAFTLGDDALDSISASKITAGTIDASQITVSNIDAGNITSGYISADRINAGTISINKLNNDAKSSIITGTTVVTQYYLSTSSSSATGGSWQNTVPTWSTGTYIWTREATAKTYASGTTQTTYQPSQNGRYDSALTTALSTGNSAASVAGNANYREQIIYKSAANGTTSMSGTTTWVTSTSNTQNAWTTRRPTYNTSYPVLFVATQRQTMGNSSGNTCTCTTPVIDETTTVIDGGRIIANSVTADQINVNTLQLGESQITNLTTHLNAKADTSSVPTKVSQLTNDSSFATTGQVSTAKTEAINTASSDATTKANNAKTSAINTASADATSKANAAQSAAISAAATDATTKANAAAQTATSYIGFATDGIKIAKNVTSATTYSLIDSSGMTVYKGGNDVAFFGATTRLGRYNEANSGYVEFSSSDFTMWRSNASKVYSNIATLEWDNYDVKLSRLSTTYLNLSSTSSPSDSEYGATLKAPTINIDGNVYFGGDGLFATFTATGTATIGGPGGNSGIACTGKVPSGYKPIAVQEITTNHGAIGSINGFSMRSNGATVGVRNSGSSSQSFTVTAKILCIRSSVNM